MVVSAVQRRFDPGQGDLDRMTVTLITVAVTFLCPQHTDSVLGP
jgi:hypothetical protein